MAVSIAQFHWAKTFVGFGPSDIAHLKGLQTLMEINGPIITDRFYEVLLATPETAKVVENRVELLKRTHKAYLLQLVAGEYDEAYFESRLRVGRVHVVQGIEPHWVEAVMSIIRGQLIALVSSHYDDPEERAAKCTAILRICDIDLLVINFAYSEERLERLTGFTGMGRKLIENVLKMPARK